MLSLVSPTDEPPRTPQGKGRRVSSGRMRRVSSLHDVPMPVPTPPPQDPEDRKQLDELRTALRQTQEENELLRQQQKRLDEEVQTAFDVSEA